jgi:glucose-6-phosphate 1-dehydrogenase
MRFAYRDAFAIPSPEAYETLLWDVMNDDPTLFMRSDQIEAAWLALMPVLDVWAESAPRGFPNYAAGTWGPKAADELLARAGHAWRPVP